MFDSDNFKRQLFFLKEADFESAALAVFQYQWQTNPVYKAYCENLRIDPAHVNMVDEIPFLPIEFYKNHTIKSGQWKEEKVFLSSGTGLGERSKHYLRSESFYHLVSRRIFEAQFGALCDYYFIGLLPSYQENPQSSLISMVDFFMKMGKNEAPVYLHEIDLFKNNLSKVQNSKVILFGVTYALLQKSASLGIENTDYLYVIETGGMKGRGKEMIREEVHHELQQILGTSHIYSEYGMSEMTSQAYGFRGVFNELPWLKVKIRDVNDPFYYFTDTRAGGVNVIDLANVDTCSFLETKDLGKRVNSNQFEILGRFDNSDIRGCNLLV